LQRRESPGWIVFGLILELTVTGGGERKKGGEGRKEKGGKKQVERDAREGPQLFSRRDWGMGKGVMKKREEGYKTWC